MYIETTMNIKYELIIRLDNAAKQLDISRSRLVSILMKKYMEENTGGTRVYNKLAYQDKGGNYVKKNLRLI